MWLQVSIIVNCLHISSGVPDDLAGKQGMTFRLYGLLSGVSEGCFCRHLSPLQHSVVFLMIGQGRYGVSRSSEPLFLSAVVWNLCPAAPGDLAVGVGCGPSLTGHCF